MRNKDRKDLEDFYYAALYDAIHTPPTTENLAITIRRLTAKIRRLSSQHMHGVLMDMEENDVLNEDITTYHYIQSRKRSKARLVTQILDNHGDIQNDKLVIMNIFTTFLESKYRTIQSDTSSFLKMTPCGMPQIPAGANIELEHLITMEGLQTMLKEMERMFSVPKLREGCTATVGQWVKMHLYWRHMLMDQGLRMSAWRDCPQQIFAVTGKIKRKKYTSHNCH